MSNKAQSSNDGICVYFNTAIITDIWQRLILIFANIFMLGMYVLICYAVTDDTLKGFSIVVVFFLLPVIYAVSLGRYTLWNIYGEERIIINKKTIAVSRNYGWFSTPWQIKQYRILYYEIVKNGNRINDGTGTIRFISHNEMDMPIVILTSTINVPLDDLEELLAHLGLVFAVEHLDDSPLHKISLN